jgi:nucleoside-diphosphate-sugar epimerase
MRVFVTGATGFIGTALIPHLLGAGHQVLGLCRSEEKAGALGAAGAEVARGSLEDLDGLKAAASSADAVVHLAFNHDFSRYVENCADDRRVIEALGAALAGSDRPLIVTSGSGMAQTAPGEPVTEDAPALSSAMMPRAATEEAAAAVSARGGNAIVVRLPQVHDTVKQGLVTPAIALFREKGACFYIGDGENRWPAAHVSDVARLYQLALEKARGGAIYHAVGEEGVRVRDIAEVLSRRLGLPLKSIAAEEAGEYFGWLAMFAALDLPASSRRTREELGWTPSGPTMLEDLERLRQS